MLLFESKRTSAAALGQIQEHDRKPRVRKDKPNSQRCRLK